MKFGIRTPDLSKRIKARTTSKIKRLTTKCVNPLYGRKGMGYINNSKKAIYNKIYNKTTIGLDDILKKFNNGLIELIILPFYLLYIIYKYFILFVLGSIKKVINIFNKGGIIMKKEKKAIYKKWWFWLLIVILFCWAIGSNDSFKEGMKDGTNNSLNNKNNTVTAVINSNELSKEKQKNEAEANNTSIKDNTKTANNKNNNEEISNKKNTQDNKIAGNSNINKNNSNISTEDKSSNKNKNTTTSVKDNSSTSNINNSSADNSQIVWVGETGSKYHRENCRTLKGNGHQITLKQAQSEGRTACKVCFK